MGIVCLNIRSIEAVEVACQMFAYLVWMLLARKSRRSFWFAKQLWERNTEVKYSMCISDGFAKTLLLRFILERATWKDTIDIKRCSLIWIYICCTIMTFCLSWYDTRNRSSFVMFECHTELCRGTEVAFSLIDLRAILRQTIEWYYLVMTAFTLLYNFGQHECVDRWCSAG